jgi:predicted component of type VI protein secretion system
MSDVENAVSNIAQQQHVGAVVASPFGDAQSQERPTHDVQVAAAREMAEVRMHLVMARELPRDEIRAYDKIIRACQRPTLAETALYQYSRGGTEITGPSIRLAEVLAAHWGNIKYGWREVERAPPSKDPVTGRIRPGRSTVSTYCTDLETNVTDERSFQVIHERSTRSSRYALEDDRDIYEAVANQAARRVRACILAIIPGDIAEAAVEQCEVTMVSKGDVSPEAVAKLVEAFGKFGVTREQIEQRLQRRIDAIHPAQVAHLRKVWKSLDDGMSVPSDWFQAKPPEPGAAPPPEPQVKGNEGLKSKMKAKAEPPPSEPEGMELGLPPQPASEREPGEEG